MKKTLVLTILTAVLGACAMQGETDQRLAMGKFNSDAERAAYFAGQRYAAGLFAEELLERGLITACKDEEGGVTYVFNPEPC